MIAARWVFSVDSLLCGSITSQPIELHSQVCQFRLISGASERLPLRLEFEFTSSLYGEIDILITAVFMHPEGPAHCISLPFAGTLSVEHPLLLCPIRESVGTLRMKGFTNQQGQMKLKFSIASPIRSLGHVLTNPKPADLVEVTLKPHDYVNACPISQSDLSWLLVKASDIFTAQPSLLHLGTPIIIVGDLHGHYFDLMRIFMRYGFPDVANYLFLGDIVDRGKNGIDILILVCAFKIMYPENFFVLRGNHESEKTSSAYGFKDECERKKIAYEPFLGLFNSLPLAAVVGEKILCTHAGISPTLTSLAEIEAFERPGEVSNFATLHDLLWSDPRSDIEHFCYSEKRGTSFQFGAKAFMKFLTNFKLELLVRAHEVVVDGFEWPFGYSVPLVTIFSATDSEGHNSASVMLVDDQLMCAIDAFKSMSAAEKDEMNTLDFNDYRRLE
jgi:serine/threonine-protein phosphatase PP1 catalytic subunit